MAAQVASSRRSQAHPPAHRRGAPEPKILRIGIIHNGRIVEERLIPTDQSVTVGDNASCTVVVSGVELPNKRFELFSGKGGAYSLNFTAAMHGKISVDEKVVTLASLATGAAKKRGAFHQLPLSEKNRGKVYVGDHTVLFQFVTPPPQPARQRSADFRVFRWDEVDWVFLAILLLSALLHTAAVVWIESLPPAPKRSLADFPDRFVKIMLPKEPEPVAEVETDPDADGPEVDAPSTESATPEPEPEPGPAAGDPGKEPGQLSEEEQRAKVVEEVSNRGLLALIGTAGASSSGQAVADMLSDGSGLSADVGKALADSNGVAVARRTDDGSGLKGGGGGDGAASIGGVGGAGGGQGGQVTATRAEPKGNVKEGNADIPAAPKDVDSVKKAMKRLSGRVKACYERELKANPDLQGKVVVAFEIGTNGKATGVEVTENSTNNAALGTCIRTEVQRASFSPPPEEPVEVVGYPFILTPG